MCLVTLIAGNGIVHADAAVWIKILFIGEREAIILDDSPPAISVYEEIEAGNDFKWKQGVGPMILRSEGATCQLDTSLRTLSYMVHAPRLLRGFHVARWGIWKRLSELAWHANHVTKLHMLVLQMGLTQRRP